MTPTHDLSFLALISNAHILVQLIMLLLLLLSVVSWSYIFRKLFAIRAARRLTEQFERSFWAGGNLHTLHQSASAQRDQSGALARIFEAGMGEFIKGKQASRDALDMGAVLDGSRRAMRAASAAWPPGIAAVRLASEVTRPHVATSPLRATRSWPIALSSRKSGAITPWPRSAASRARTTS